MRVLVVQSEPRIGLGIKDLLRSMGCEVITADNLLTANDQGTDLLVIDEISACQYGVAAILRQPDVQLPSEIILTPRTTFVLDSAYSNDRIKVMPQPIDAEELEAHIASLTPSVSSEGGTLLDG